MSNSKFVALFHMESGRGDKGKGGKIVKTSTSVLKVIFGSNGNDSDSD
jgi:hypothetical protein